MLKWLTKGDLSEPGEEMLRWMNDGVQSASDEFYRMSYDESCDCK